MTKIIAALVFVALTTAAQAQQRTHYDASGKIVGRSSTDSSGTVTNYGADGRVISRESTDSSGTRTIVDSRGKIIGRETTKR